jgi:hypothetical protein
MSVVERKAINQSERMTLMVEAEHRAKVGVLGGKGDDLSDLTDLEDLVCLVSFRRQQEQALITRLVAFTLVTTTIHDPHSTLSR